MLVSVPFRYAYITIFVATPLHTTINRPCWLRLRLTEPASFLKASTSRPEASYTLTSWQPLLVTTNPPSQATTLLAVDVVLVMPAGIPPHKHASATPGELRLAMCECFKALGPQVQVSQWEVDRAGRSYTYNTVSMLQEKYPGAQLYMTIGSDMLETFDEWYRWREILAMVTLVVQSREPGDGDALRAAAQKLEEAGGKIMFADAPVLECASSDIRAGKYPPARLKELLPPPVADVIHRNGLYGKLI